MIHVVTLEPFEADEIQAVCRSLFAAFGVGSEHVGELELPDDARDGSRLDAPKLLAEAGPVKTFADDKIVFLVQSAFDDRAGPRGALPTQGYAKYGGDRATASAAGLPADPEARGRLLAKLAVHQVGHLWDLHHCLDHRCAMTPPWGVAYARSQLPELCSFCREKSERRMKTTAA